MNFYLPLSADYKLQDISFSEILVSPLFLCYKQNIKRHFFPLSNPPSVLILRA